MLVDLHTHSVNSDGDLPLEELKERLSKLDLGFVTDHDLLTVNQTSFGPVSSAEVTALVPGLREVRHFTVYLKGEPLPSIFISDLTHNRHAWHKCMLLIMESCEHSSPLLKKHREKWMPQWLSGKLEIRLAAAEEIAREEGREVLGVLEEIYSDQGLYGKFSEGMMSLDYLVRTVHAKNKGIVLLAHPDQTTLDAVRDDVDGWEIDSPLMKIKVVDKNKIMSVGTDYHRPYLGKGDVGVEVEEELLTPFLTWLKE